MKLFFFVFIDSVGIAFLQKIHGRFEFPLLLLRSLFTNQIIIQE